MFAFSLLVDDSSERRERKKGKKGKKRERERFSLSQQCVCFGRGAKTLRISRKVAQEWTQFLHTKERNLQSLTTFSVRRGARMMIGFD